MSDSIDVEEREPQKAVSMRFECAAPAMRSNLEKILPLVAAYTKSRGGEIDGPPYLRYHAMIDGQFFLEAGFPVTKGIPKNSLVDNTELPGGKVVITRHVGPYTELGSTHKKVRNWIRDSDFVPSGPAWDIYLDDPEEMDPEEVTTQIIYPVRPTD